MNPNGKTCTLDPTGWPCKLKDCPPGYFAWGYSPEGTDKTDSIQIGFMSEYSDKSYNEGGEYLTLDEEYMVQPLEIKWEYLL